MVDRGHGTPIVLIPGLQGRWEWIRPAVDALATHYRVISFSLCDERTSPFPCDPAKGFENYLEQVDLALDRAGVERAVIAGVSFGGLIATEFAARRPERVTQLVLASALHKSWRPDRRQEQYLSSPVLMSPLFAATAPSRMLAELAASLPTMTEWLRFVSWQSARVVLSPTTPSRMARRIAWARSHRFANPCDVKAPALLVTGEAGLDRIVPVDVSCRYLEDLAGAEHVVLKDTGHFGVVTRPREFADALGRFVDGARLSA